MRALLIQKDAKHIISETNKKIKFESFVNSERCKTFSMIFVFPGGLRALLIQKDAKRLVMQYSTTAGLRALLIQKDAKLRAPRNYRKACLRALLIQKDAKLKAIVTFTSNV